MSKEIPINEAKSLSEKYGYEQVIILAQKENETKPNGVDAWATTFNKDKAKCKFLGKISAILIYNFRAFYSNEKTTEKYYQKLIKIKEVYPEKFK